MSDGLDKWSGRPRNFIFTIQRSLESGTEINWAIMQQQLTDLFYQTHRDGIEQGSSMRDFYKSEQKSLERALSRLLEMGGILVHKTQARHKREAIESLENELIALFKEVVADGLDLSGKKLDRLVTKYAESTTHLIEELKEEENAEG